MRCLPRLHFSLSLLARSHSEGDEKFPSTLLVFLSQKAHCFHLSGFFFTILFYVYRCFAYMSVHYMCVVPEETRRERPLGVRVGCELPLGARNQTWVLCKRIQCSLLPSHLFSTPVSAFDLVTLSHHPVATGTFLLLLFNVFLCI